MSGINISDIERIVAEVLSRVKTGQPANEASLGRIPAEVSARHVHLDEAALEQLFGKDYSLTPKRDLSQPGQYLAQERLKIVTEKGEFSNVAILGPLRKQVQVELSCTDARTLGIDPPLRLSGDLDGAEDVILVGPKGVYHAKGSAIIAKAHVHMTPKDASKFGVSDGQHVSVLIEGKRPLRLEDVLVRVTEQSALALHMDYDEANAAMFSGSGTALMLGCACKEQHEPAVQPAAEESEIKSYTGSTKKRLITEEDARAMVAQGRKEPPAGAMLTPSAKDVFADACRSYR